MQYRHLYSLISLYVLIYYSVLFPIYLFVSLQESINSFLQQLLAGRAPVSDLPKLKQLKDAKKWAPPKASKDEL